MKLQLLTHREALAALADGAAVYTIGQTSLRPASRTKARALCVDRIASSKSPSLANEEGDLIFVGYDPDNVSRNFKAYCQLVAS